MQLIIIGNNLHSDYSTLILLIVIIVFSYTIKVTDIFWISICELFDLINFPFKQVSE